MASSLTSLGFLWAFLSLTAALGSCVAFYLPFWIQGRLGTNYYTYFGSFRRCNFPRSMLSPLLDDHGVMEVVEECGRYSSFWAIPTEWWQVTTVVMGTGCALSLLVAFMAAAGCCISYVFNSASVKFVGSLQLLSVLLILAGAATFPVGWYTPEVREACGIEAGIYSLGHCEISWSTFLMAGSVLILFVCFLMSSKASKVKPGSIPL